MSKPGNRPASNDSASVTVDPTNLGATAAAPIGREIDRRVDPIVAAVLACPQVAGLHGGRDGQAVTYLPGRRITGIRITVDEVAIHVVARAFGGLVAFLIVLVLGAVGLIVGRSADGALDLSSLTGSSRDRSR
jgi:hypothetical protein